jgi:hypothetical protein
MTASFKIKEHSFIAKLAAMKLRSKQVAIVIGKTIHLHNTSRAEFLSDERWLKHELCHIDQFRRYGFFRFLGMYLWETLKNGYYQNRFEVEARSAERENSTVTTAQ